jgi:4-amino-4-deoxy-L-arabinose transferase-like glycosyltransferase
MYKKHILNQHVAPKNTIAETLFYFLLAVLVILLFLGAPSDGDFYWSDSPRHALNGVFVKDLLAALPWHDPTGFAYSYYAQYPALTILFYPPLFYFLSAPFYWLLGFSHNTALLVIMLHYIAFAWGSWHLFRIWLPGWSAIAATISLVAAPEIAFWGRQVMLEIPAFAFLIWGTVLFIHYTRTKRPSLLYWAAALLVLAIYTKISVAFMAVVWAATLLIDRRLSLFKDRHIWISLLVSLFALIPLLIMTAKFGQANVQSVSGIPDATVSRASIDGWVWYLRQIPMQMGWFMCILAALGLALLILDSKKFLSEGSVSSSRRDFWFWFLWGVVGYLFFSSIDLKEARHSVYILPPIVMAATMAILYVSSKGYSKVAIFLWLVMPVAVLMQTIFFRPVLFVHGYANAADYVAKHAPHNSRVLFSGYRDGSFVFNMRCREDRRDIGVVRADKLLLNVAVRRELGVTEKQLSENELSNTINQLGIHYVVVQPGFWADLEAMQKLERLLSSSQFQKVAQIETPANYNAHEKILLIYKNLGPVSNEQSGLEISLPIIGKTIDTTK